MASKGTAATGVLPVGAVGQPRRRELLELLDRLSPTIAELSQAIEKEAEKCPEAQRLMTHPGVGALTALAFVLIIGNAERFGCGKQVASYLGSVPLEEIQRESAAPGAHHQTREFDRTFLAGGSCASHVRSLPEWRGSLK